MRVYLKVALQLFQGHRNCLCSINKVMMVRDCFVNNGILKRCQNIGL